ncbi:MAG: DUF342 domain-containing protein [Phycisphaeraceae bacterium]|nr:DUF342 domain-containing protein [Phycisphaeraceae bacterium]
MSDQLKRPDADSQGGLSTGSTRRWAIEAEGFLASDCVEPGLEDPLAELRVESSDLVESELAQLAEITRLLRVSGQEARELASLRQDGKFEFEVSSDRMEMNLQVTSPVAGGRAVELGELLEHLRGQGITQGVDLAVIRRAVEAAQRGEALSAVVAVRGRPAEAGSLPDIEVYYRRGMNQPQRTVKLTDPALEGDEVMLCASGDKIMRALPPTAGRQGYDATGQVLPPPAIPPRAIEVGSNVRREGHDYFSTRSGQIILQHGRLEVRRVMIVHEDVTRMSGPIDFDGEVQIHAGVRGGSVIKATGSILIDGPVEDAVIESTGGDVRLRHGVAGRYRGTIRAAQDVISRFAEGVSIYAGRHIVIEAGSLHSHLTAGSMIRMIGGRGQMIGGIAMAGDRVEVKQLGSDGNVVTDVTVGLHQDVMLRLAEVDDRILEMKRRHEKAKEMADNLQRMVGDPTKLAAEELKIYTRLRQVELLVGLRLRRTEGERLRVMDEAAKAHKGSVDVHGRALPGVRVRIGSSSVENHEIRQRCRIEYNAQCERIVFRPLK